MIVNNQEELLAVSKFHDPCRNWGKLDEHNAARVRITQELIPEGVTSVLDVGCGDGAVTNSLVDDGLEVTGIDASKVALSYFRGKSIVGDIEKLPFANDSFDVVISTEVLEHLPPKKGDLVLAELERVARKAIILSTPYSEYLPNGLVKCSACATCYHANHHIRSYTRKDYEQFFSNFVSVRIVGVGEWKQSLIVVALKHALGVYIWRDGLVCSACGHEGEPEPQWIRNPIGINILRRGLLGLLMPLFRYFFPGRTKSRWIVGLFLQGGNK